MQKDKLIKDVRHKYRCGVLTHKEMMDKIKNIKNPPKKRDIPFLDSFFQI